jgi:hypothetical protein
MRLDVAELVRQFPRAGLVADAERFRESSARSRISVPSSSSSLETR